MPTETISELAELRAEIARLSERLAKLEVAGQAVSPVRAQVPEPPPKEPESITEEELLAISAAVAAYLGVKAHIRQIRLISSGRWAQEGRVSIQASHRLHS
jgi:methylmalonyl-CoA carboxyltransferase large subunit